MRKLTYVAIVLVALFFTFRYCATEQSKKEAVLEHSLLIQQQIKNVGKLVVTEGHFSEVFSYKDSKEVFPYLVSAEKKSSSSCKCRC